MSVKYKLIQRKDMSSDAGPGSKLYYAQAVSAGEMTLDELCEDIAESSTVTSADVKAVLDRLGWILSKNLKAGRIVQVGELGNFRMTLGSSGAPTIEEFNSSLIRKPKAGAPTIEEFNSSLIRKPKVSFHPGKRLQETRSLVSFERIGGEDSTSPTSPDGEGEEDEGIE